MVRRVAFVSLAVFVLSATWIACGSSATSAPATANDAGSSGDAGAYPRDDGGDAAAAEAGDGGCTVAVVDDGIELYCPGTSATSRCPTSGTNVCCVTDAGASCQTSACGSTSLACDDTEDCAGAVCCVKAAAKGAAACGPIFDIAGSTCVATAADCANAGGKPACTLDEGCTGGGACTQVETHFEDGAKAVWALCL